MGLEAIRELVQQFPFLLVHLFPAQAAFLQATQAGDEQAGSPVLVGHPDFKVFHFDFARQFEGGVGHLPDSM